MKVLSAVAAALGYSSMTPMQVDNFIGGLVYGMVGHDDLAYISVCLKGTETLSAEIEKAVKILEMGSPPSKDSMLLFVETAGKIIEQLPQDLGNCQNIQPDIDRINNWSKFFDDPTTLVETVAKNYI